MTINKELVKEYLTTTINKNNIWKKYYNKKDTGVLLKWLRQLNVEDKKITVFEYEKRFNPQPGLVHPSHIQYQNYLKESVLAVFDLHIAEALNTRISESKSVEDLSNLATKIDNLMTLYEAIIQDINDVKFYTKDLNVDNSIKLDSSYSKVVNCNFSSIRNYLDYIYDSISFIGLRSIKSYLKNIINEYLVNINFIKLSHLDNLADTLFNKIFKRLQYLENEVNEIINS